VKAWAIASGVDLTEIVSMNKALVQIAVLLLLIMATVAPFASLAPLLVVLLILGVGYTLVSLVQILLLGTPKKEN
jgi:hypothetical protein